MTDLGPTIDHEFLNQYREFDEPGEPGMISQIVKRFFESSEARIRSLEKSISENKPDHIKSDAHALKSTSGNAGAKRLASLCGILEESAAEGSVRNAPQALEEIRRELKAAKEQLQTYLEG